MQQFIIDILFSLSGDDAFDTPPYSKVHRKSLPSFGNMQENWSGAIPDNTMHASNSNHKLVSTEGKKLRGCAYCNFYKVKTKSGWGVYTRHKCEACDVPLCKKVRPCFYLYHDMKVPPYFSMSSSNLSDILKL